MIVMNLELDNLFGFNNFKANFSYPKKIVNSTIQGEYLQNKPNFRYKKVNILMGANASGKTSLGSAIKDIFNFIFQRDILCFSNDISDENQKASFSIDFLLTDKILYRVKSSFSSKEIISYELFTSEILKNDSYETCVKKLHLLEDDSINENAVLGWLFSFPKDKQSDFSRLKNNIHIMDINILKAILKTLDTSITNVEKSKEVADSYIIRSKNGDGFIQDGKVANRNILSSGTKAGIDIAYLLSAIYKDSHGFYYCDEQFSFIQSDAEQAILSLMISFLKPDNQLFFTTHNLDVLEMNLPIHSFLFLRKDENIKVIHPETKIKKNDVSLRNAVKNDVFDISPDINELLALEELCVENDYA